MVDPKLYPTFQPPERLTLLLQAMARRDDAEVDRLTASCPRRSYTQNDARYDDRVRLAFDLLAVTCIDLRAMWAKLYTLEWAKHVVRQCAPAQHLTAALGFVDGAGCTQGLAQSPFFRPGADDDGADDEDEPELVRAPGFADRMAAVQARSERATADVLELFGGAAEVVAQELADTWAAFDRFCQSRIGVDGPTVFAAWQMPLADDVQGMLKLHPGVTPDPEKVRAYRRLLDLNWDRRFREGGSGGD